MKYFLSLLTSLFASATFAAAAANSSSPAQQRIAAASQVIQANPASSQAYNDLAAALCRRARETGDAAFFDQAGQAINQSLKITPNNYDARKLRALALLGRHDFAAALQLAKTLNHSVPDDIPVWGLMAQADIAIGNYAEAEKAAQWMLDLRLGNAPAFIRSAELREIFGDLDGAMEFLDEAYRRTPETETEDRAFLLTETARVHLLAGDKRRAESLLQQVLTAYPDYHLALRTLAKLRAAEGNYDAAVDLLQRRHLQVNSSASLYELAEALQKAGRQPEAGKAFTEFLEKANAETDSPFNSNRELIFYYADHSKDPAKALAVAEREKLTRHDVYTQDARAWALYRNRKFPEAASELTLALAVGVRDPEIFCHAGQIAAATGDMVASRKYLDLAAPSCVGVGK